MDGRSETLPSGLAAVPTAKPAAPAFSKRLYVLQGLRAYAAGLVIFVHALATWGAKVDAANLPVMRGGLGELGVKLFFCISGFIIYTTARKLAPGWPAVGHFLRRRLIRVVPIYWIVTSVYALKLMLQGNAPTLEHYLKSLLFIPYVDGAGLMRPVVGVGWSLNYEMFFYLLFAVGLLFARQLRVLLLLSVLSCLVLLRNGGALAYGAGAFTDILYLLADHYLLYFLAGLLIAVGRDWLEQRGGAPTLDFNVCLAVATTALGVYLGLHFLDLVPEPLRETSIAALCVLCLSVSVVERTHAPGQSEGAARRWLQMAGDASYSTYLTHGFVMGPAARVVALLHLELPPLLFALLMVPVCTGAGILVYRLVERPVLDRLNERFA